MRLCLMLTLLCVVACQSVNPNEFKTLKTEHKALGKAFTQKQQQIIQLEEEKLVLKTLLQSKRPKKSKKQALKPMIINEKININVPAGSEIETYKFIHISWKNNKYDSVLAGVALMKSRFPNSQYLDDSLFILSKLDFSQGSLTSALRGVNEILAHFESSNVRLNALYLKAQIYKSMQLAGPYKSVLEELIEKSPDSTAGRRAKVELSKIY